MKKMKEKLQIQLNFVFCGVCISYTDLSCPDMKHLILELYQMTDLSKVVWIFCYYMIKAVVNYTLSDIYVFYLLVPCLLTKQ